MIHAVPTTDATDTEWEVTVRVSRYGGSFSTDYVSAECVETGETITDWREMERRGLDLEWVADRALEDL